MIKDEDDDDDDVMHKGEMIKEELHHYMALCKGKGRINLRCYW